MYAKGVRPRYCNYLTLLLHKTRSAVTAGPKLLPKNRDFGNTLLEGAQALHPRNLYSQNVTETAELLRAEVFVSGHFRHQQQTLGCSRKLVKGWDQWIIIPIFSPFRSM